MKSSLEAFAIGGEVVYKVDYRHTSSFDGWIMSLEFHDKIKIFREIGTLIADWAWASESLSLLDLIGIVYDFI